MLKSILLNVIILACFNVYTQCAGDDPELTQKWFNAVNNKYLKVLQSLIGKVSVNVQDKKGKTALIRAIQNEHEQTIDFLLQAPDLDVNIADMTGNTALMYATALGNTKVVSSLTQWPHINVNACNKYGTSSLILAAYRGHEQITRLLMAVPNLDVNARTNLGDSALLVASFYGHDSVVKLLLEYPEINLNFQDEDGLTAFKYAAYNKKISALINSKNRTLAKEAFQALKNDNYSAFNKIIDRADPAILNFVDSAGDTLIHKTFSKNLTDITLLLLQKSDDPRQHLNTRNSQGQMPLELINPTSPIFSLCLDIAFKPKTDIKSRITRLLNLKPKHYCAHCYKPSCTDRCALCKKVYYCSQECQKAHWIIHKNNCAQ